MVLGSLGGLKYPEGPSTQYFRTVVPKSLWAKGWDSIENA